MRSHVNVSLITNSYLMITVTNFHDSFMILQMGKSSKLERKSKKDMGKDVIDETMVTIMHDEQMKAIMAQLAVFTQALAPAPMVQVEEKKRARKH